MMIVRDLSRLKEYGFTLHDEEEQIYSKRLETNDKEDLPSCLTVELIVNPTNSNARENEIFFYIYVDFRAGAVMPELDAVFGFGEIFKLIEDGVIEYKKEENQDA